MIEAKVIADSIGVQAPRLITFEVEYPRIIHAELMTHRVFSRNASSSRAIPVDRMLRRIENDPAQPVEWRMNEPGMQGYTVAPAHIAEEATRLTLLGRDFMMNIARQMEALGLHKQHVNRETERWQHIKVVITSSQWMNWFGLRDHEAADPTIAALARAMRAAMEASAPQFLRQGEWHLPYITEHDAERAKAFLTNAGRSDLAVVKFLKRMSVARSDLAVVECLKRMSVARCGRVSYNNFKGEVPEVASDLALFEKLVVAQPVHASPSEHQASPDFKLGASTDRWSAPERHGNLTGWLQFRKFIPHENLEHSIN